MTEINKAKEWAKGQLAQVAKAAEARKGAPGERAFTAAKADPLFEKADSLFEKASPE